MEGKKRRQSTVPVLLGVMAGASVLACSSSSLMSPNADGGGDVVAGPAAWSRAGTAAFPPRMSHLGLVLDNRIWIMGGQGSDGTLRNDVWSSADGVAWTMATAAAAWSPRELTAGVVYQNKMWLVDGSPRSSEVWTSTDGATWTSVTQAAPFSPRYGHCALVHDDKVWILGGYGASGADLNDVWSSTDGATWARATPAAAWSPRSNFGCVAHAGKMWVIDGVRQGDVWTSTDGVTWTAVTPTMPFVPSLTLATVVWRGEMWTLGGYDILGQPINAVFHSPDGVAWTRMADVPWSPRTFGAAVVHADKVWLIDGDVRLGEVWKME
jgi:hypothetical protein